MAEALNKAQQEFWRSPTQVEPMAVMEALVGTTGVASSALADVCSGCGAEFMIGARFCHSCGAVRAEKAIAGDAVPALAALLSQPRAKARVAISVLLNSWREIEFPGWLRYLHFHEIQRGIGLPTASLVSFLLGVGCLVGAAGISFFYKASTLAEFDAIQMWRLQWLLAATAAFVAGILLKTPSDTDRS